MQDKGREHFDVIIIGAGISGLVCGGYLAKAGLKVLLAEQHDKPGGYFTSFRRREFLFDAAAHSFGNYREGGHVRKILTELGVHQIVNIERFDPSDVVITPDFKFAVHNDIRDTIAELSGIFPREKNNISSFFKFLTSDDQSAFAALRTRTFGELLSCYFTDTRLISSLGFPVFGSGGLPPSMMQAFIGAKIFSEFILDGGYYPEGGMQVLPDALARVIQENNGNILYKSHVKKILCSNNRAVGIELDNASYEARHVVSACDMTQTFKTLLPEAKTESRHMDTLNSMVPSSSFFLLYIGVDSAFEELPSKGTNIWHLNTYDLDQLYRNIKNCRFDETCSYLLRLSPDSKTLLASCLADFNTPAFWIENKRKIVQLLLNRITKNFPHLEKHISYFDAATPLTLHRYTLNHKGSAFGWAKTPSQVFDPIFTKKTSIDGFYLTGHWTNIGFGMPGACYSAYETAKRILREKKTT